MIGTRVRKLGPSETRDGGGTVWDVISNGQPMNGTANDDFMFGYAPSSAVDNTINALGGDDMVLGDMTDFMRLAASVHNGTLASAVSVDAGAFWTEDPNPLVGELSFFSEGLGVTVVPHMTVYVDATAGEEEWFKVVVEPIIDVDSDDSPFSRLAIDVDYGFSPVGSPTDTVIQLYDSAGVLIASNDTSAAGEGGYGSTSTADPYLLRGASGAAVFFGVFYIRIFESVSGIGLAPLADGIDNTETFESGENFMLHISATRQSGTSTMPAGNDTIDGGTGNDELFGLGGNDILIGGTGADLMHGGPGNDLFGVDSAADVIVELVGEGDDTLVASVGYALAAGVSVDAITTPNQALTTPLNFTGNELAQSIFGNEGNNQLLGLGGNDQLVGYGGNDVLVGGLGIDYLRGGLGNDVYGIGEGDIILEVAGEGDDSLAADIGSYFLNEGASIETLSTANQAGTFAQNLTGNELGQTVAGSEGANVLNGRLGIDLLRGYGGADIFLFDTTPNGSTNYDVIADMAVGVDKIALQNATFAGLAEGNLGANQFRAGTAAQDADDRVIWNAATNQLFFDADGLGGDAQILFAIVNGSPNLQATDFMIV